MRVQWETSLSLTFIRNESYPPLGCTTQKNTQRKTRVKEAENNNGGPQVCSNRSSPHLLVFRHHQTAKKQCIHAQVLLLLRCVPPPCFLHWSALMGVGSVSQKGSQSSGCCTGYSLMHLLRANMTCSNESVDVFPSSGRCNASKYTYRGLIISLMLPWCWVGKLCLIPR